MVAPMSRAPLASALQQPAGSTWPSPVVHAPARTPSTLTKGLICLIFSGSMISQWKPMSLPTLATWWNHSTSAGLKANRMPPHPCQLTYCPVFSSSFG